jgi:ABC-type sugar transport system ATPase subunit
LAVTTIYVTHDQEEAMTLGDRIAVLRNGRLQQCGTPLDVYHAPANRFVAGFIGTPSMNFIEGRVSEDAAGQPWFESPSLRVPIDKNRVRGILPATGEKVVLGIRPDNLRLQPASSDAERLGWSISGTVEVVEPLGSTMDLHVRIANGQRFVCRVPAGPIQCDSEATLYVDSLKTHLFAADELNS